MEAAKFAAFNARCPFEVGDKFKGKDGKEHTITDIVAVLSMKTMTVNFVYELDNNGKLVGLAVEPQEGGKTSEAIDRIMKKEVPGYAYTKKSMPQAGAAREPKKKCQQKPRTLTEISGSGKAVLRKGVTVTQAARKLNRYEETGLAPQEVLNLIEQTRNLEKRVEKLEGWL